MKESLMLFQNKILLLKRALVESVHDELKTFATLNIQGTVVSKIFVKPILRNYCLLFIT